jgi:hypothetical protein
VVRHVREHCPEMGIVECADETVYLKVAQPVRLAYCIHHVCRLVSQESVGSVLEFGENDVIINLPFHNYRGSQNIVALLKEFSKSLPVVFSS